MLAPASIRPSPAGPDRTRFISLSLSAKGHVIDVARGGVLLGRIVGDGAPALAYVMPTPGQCQVGGVHPGFRTALAAVLREAM